MKAIGVLRIGYLLVFGVTMHFLLVDVGPENAWKVWLLLGVSFLMALIVAWLISPERKD